MKLAPLALVFVLAGCATASHQDRESLLAEPIDCTIADEDIAALQAAMPSRRERARSAVQSITPVGVATGVISGSYGDRASVLTGRTEDELAARIEEIEVTCGAAESNDSSTEKDAE